MKLKSFRYLISLLIICFYSPLMGEEKIDIWSNKEEKNTQDLDKKKK